MCASNQKNIADHVIATSGEYYDMIHADFAAMGWKYHPHSKTTKHICVSNLVKKSIEQQDSKPCITIYNLLEQPKPQKPIMILSAQRFSVEKGANEMKKFAQRLRAKIYRLFGYVSPIIKRRGRWYYVPHSSYGLTKLLSRV